MTKEEKCEACILVFKAFNTFISNPKRVEKIMP